MNECTGGDWETRNFVWIDYLVFAAVLLVTVGIGVFYGFFSKGKQQTTAELLMGNRQMNFKTLSVSLCVGFASAIALLGNAAEMYNYGTQYVLSLVGLLVMVPCTQCLFLPVFRELGITSIYEYLERRFGNPMRLFVSITYMIQMWMYLSVVVYAPALALRQVTGISTMLAVAIIFAVGIFYSSVGGLKAVVWSDVFQASIIAAALITVVVRGSMADGGPGPIWQLAYESGRVEFFNFDLDPRVRHTVWSSIIGITFYWVCMNTGQATLQRLLAVPSQRESLKALCLSCVGMLVMYLTTFYIGLMMYAHFYKCDPLLSKAIDASDQLLPLYMMDVAGTLPGLPGLFVAGIFCASLSTLASSLNAISASMLRDLLGGAFGYHPPEDHATLITRLLAIAFGVASFALTFVVAQLGGVLQIAISVNGMVIGVVFAIFLLGMYVPWSNTKGTLIGALIGFAIVLWLGMGAQIATIQGRLVHRKKEVGLDCDCNVTLPPEVPLEDVFDGYRMSYLWYAPLGWVITLTIGMIASLLLGGNDATCVDTALLAPVVRKCFIKKYNLRKESSSSSSPKNETETGMKMDVLTQHL